MKNINRMEIIVIGFIFMLGCSQKELNKLRSENQNLKSKIASLEQEIVKFKETADYHYKQGIDLLALEKYEEAKKEFQTVIVKYPTAIIIASAKQQWTKVNGILMEIEAQRIKEQKRIESERQAEERRRQEEEKYRPRTELEALAEWNEFRKNEKRYKGTVITWKFKVRSRYNEKMYGNLPKSDNLSGLSSCEVYVKHPLEGYGTKNKLSKSQSEAIIKAFIDVVEDDYISVTGRFDGVTYEGDIVLDPIRIKIEEYKGQ